MSIFKDKVAIVTGAASGLGKALAEGLAQSGAFVVLADVNPDGVEEAAQAIRKAGHEAEAATIDVTRFEAVKGRVEATVQEHGRLDYMFNNAGMLIFGEARDCSIQDWRSVIDLDLYGVVNGIVAAYPIMVEQGFGHIVNISSVEGLVPFPVMGSYVASKYGVVGLSNSLRVEGADLGVKVTVACPGYVRTLIIEKSKMVKIERQKILDALMDSMGVTPKECAAKILRGVERNKATIVITWWAKALWALNRLSPRLVSWMMKMMTRQLRKRGFRSG